MNTSSKRFQSFVFLADDIFNQNYCKADDSNECKLSLLVRLLIDVYWEGWHDNAIGQYEVK